ncbi:unnamed protein product [Closterium sp. NIES-54]
MNRHRGPANRAAAAHAGWLSRAVSAVFSVVSVAEFEILFVAFLVLVYLFVRDLLQQPRFSGIFAHKSSQAEFGFLFGGGGARGGGAAGGAGGAGGAFGGGQGAF